MKETVELLGYIYVGIDNGDGVKLQRENIQSTCEMGNNLVIHTERYGVVVFHKTHEVVKGDGITLYLKATHIPQLEKREYQKYHSIRDRLLNAIKELEEKIDNIRSDVNWYTNKIDAGFQSKFIDVEQFIQEDRLKLMNINAKKHHNGN